LPDVRGALSPFAAISLPRETAAAVGAIRLFVGATTQEELEVLLRGGLQWDALLEQAEREGITGLVAQALERAGPREDLAVNLARWRAATRAVVASNLSALSELSALRAALREAGRQMILLKGAALLDEQYGGRVGLRPLGDVDLLLRPSDLPWVAGWLRRRGYKPASSSSPFFSRGVVSFDLHEEIVGSEWVGRKAHAFRLDPAALWREAVPREPGDTTMLVLSPVHLRLQLAVHALKHSYSRLIWLVDLALVLRDAPWPALLEHARASGALRPLAYAVSALDWLLGRFEVSEVVRRELPALGRLERGFIRLVARRSGVETPGDLMVALSIPGLMGKAAYLAELGIPRRHVLARHYPVTPSWLLYPRRVARLASLGLREVAKLCYRRGS